MKLTDNFTLEEFTQSDTAIRLGIKNIASPTIIGRLKLVAEQMEKIRKLLGFPVFINSGYRSPELNKKIGGSATSAHCEGYAVDFVCRKFGTADEIVKVIKHSGLKYDQLIGEGTWVHISFDPRMRQQTLRALFNKGKATYHPFN